MCVSLNRTSLPAQTPANTSTEIASKALKEQTLDLTLPKEGNYRQFGTQDEASFKSTQIPKGMDFPHIPVYQNPKDTNPVKLTEYSPNSAKIEFKSQDPNEKSLVTIKVRNEEFDNGLYVRTESHMSIDSPYLKDKARDYAKETLMNSVVTPLRDTIGKTAADTTLGVAVVATALVSAKHLPDGNVKIDIPTKNLIGDKDLKTRLIFGYGDGNNLKATGVEIKDNFEYKDKNIEVKATYRKDTEVNGHKGVTKSEIQANITDKNRKEDSGTLAVSIGHNEVTGTTAGIFYFKQF